MYLHPHHDDLPNPCLLECVLYIIECVLLLLPLCTHLHPHRYDFMSRRWRKAHVIVLFSSLRAGITRRSVAEVQSLARAGGYFNV